MTHGIPLFPVRCCFDETASVKLSILGKVRLSCCGFLRAGTPALPHRRLRGPRRRVGNVRPERQE